MVRLNTETKHLCNRGDRVKNSLMREEGEGEARKF